MRPPNFFLTFETRIKAGYSHTLSLEPVICVRPLRLIVLGDPNPFRVTEIVACRTNLMGGLGVIDAKIFNPLHECERCRAKAESHALIDMTWPMVPAGVPIRIGVKNVNLADATFEGYLLCQDLSQERLGISPAEIREVFGFNRIREQFAPPELDPELPPQTSIMRLDAEGYALVKPDMNHPAVRNAAERMRVAIGLLTSKSAAWPDDARHAVTSIKEALDVLAVDDESEVK